MKSFKKLWCVFFAIFFLKCTIPCGLFAQNQAMLLPFSGDTDPSTGTKMLNFINPSSTIVTTLPKHNFYYGSIPGNPHDEIHLQATNTGTSTDPHYIMDDVYVGQHPMFAQQVVHDKNGNLLFFIVDNNIYNKKGEAFLEDPNDESPGFYYFV